MSTDPNRNHRPDYWLDSLIIRLDETPPNAPGYTWLRLEKAFIETCIFSGRQEVQR